MLTSYLYELSPTRFNNTIANLEALIKQNAKKCNLLLATGTSGGLVVAALAAKMGVAWAYVRKGGVGDSHASYDVEIAGLQSPTVSIIFDGNPPSRANNKLNIVFIDDLVDTGTSYHKSKKVLKISLKQWGWQEEEIEFLGAALYHYEYFRCDEEI